MTTYVITGANGHLGGTLVRLLSGQDCEIRGLVLSGENVKDAGNVRYFFGDVTQPQTLEPLLEGLDGGDTVLIHTAGLVDIGDRPLEELRRVNVEGTKNVIALCREHGVGRMVHVSSVHAIPIREKEAVLSETDAFSPEWVEGNYAKSKAEATQLVLDAAREGLDAVVVHPSGILGPYDLAGNHLVQVVRDYMLGKLPACVRGGYDMVDVRDVAQGCLDAAQRGRRGECYILSNRHYEIKDMLGMVRTNAGGRRLPVLPLWMARAAAPLLAFGAKLRGRRPLYTAYSLHALGDNDRFSHDKATMELHFRPRDLRLTVRDTVAWLRSQGVGVKNIRRRRAKE